MKRFLAIILTLFFINSFAIAQEDILRDYDGIELSKGTFIPVISAQEISTEVMDEGSKVEFIATNDLYLHEKNVIPKDTKLYGYIYKINEPVIGTNSSMLIRITKILLADGFEIPVKAYIYSSNNFLIGGELTDPASFEVKPSYRQGYGKGYCNYVPGPTRKMGKHTIIASGANLLVILVAPMWITHIVTNWQTINLK